jgi:hypothetical protein
MTPSTPLPDKNLVMWTNKPHTINQYIQGLKMIWEHYKYKGNSKFAIDPPIKNNMQ